jgi:hypothetical protein
MFGSMNVTAAAQPVAGATLAAAPAVAPAAPAPAPAGRQMLSDDLFGGGGMAQPGGTGNMGFRAAPPQPLGGYGAAPQTAAAPSQFDQFSTGGGMGGAMGGMGTVETGGMGVVGQLLADEPSTSSPDPFGDLGASIGVSAPKPKPKPKEPDAPAASAGVGMMGGMGGGFGATGGMQGMMGGMQGMMPGAQMSQMGGFAQQPGMMHLQQQQQQQSDDDAAAADDGAAAGRDARRGRDASNAARHDDGRPDSANAATGFRSWGTADDAWRGRASAAHPTSGWRRTLCAE